MEQSVLLDGPPVTVRASADSDDDATAVTASVAPALLRLQAYGLVIRGPVTILIHDDVAGFVRATGQTRASLRAWTTWGVVHLLPRSTWNDASGEATTARVAHELCHVALFHRHRDEADARAHRAPFFVTEGICSVVAAQENHRLPLAAVQARADEAIDFEGGPSFAYAYAHHVVASVERCRGPAALIALYDRTSAGEDVQSVLGSHPARWLDGCVESPTNAAPPPTRADFAVR